MRQGQKEREREGEREGDGLSERGRRHGAGVKGGIVFIEYKGTSPRKGRERMLDRMRANFLSSSIFGDWKDRFTLLRASFRTQREEIPFSLLIEKNLSIEGILERNVPEKK